MRLDLRADRTLIRAEGKSIRYVLLTVVAPAAPLRKDRLPVNISLVLDRSGSMEGPKIEMARQAALRVVNILNAEDRFSVVAYDEHADVVVPSTAATPAARASSQRAIETIQSRGATDLCKGWLRGCEQVATSLGNEDIGRTLLLSDGLANRGITDHAQILGHAAELRRRRVSTSAFGFGEDYDDQLMRGIAEAGGGHFYLIERPEQIPDVIASETGEALEITAGDVVLHVDAGHEVDIESMNNFPMRRETVGCRIELGSLVSGQVLTVAVKLTFPTGMKHQTRAASFSLRDRDGRQTEPQLVRWEYAGHAANDGQPRDTEVDRRVAELYAARVETEALNRNRAGDFRGAERILKACARRIRSYAGNDPLLNGIVSRLERRADELAVDVDEMSRKRSSYAAASLLKARSVRGLSRRGAAVVVLPTSATIAELVREAQGRLAGEDPLMFAESRVAMDFEGSLAGRVGVPLGLDAFAGLCRAVERALPAASVRVVVADCAFEDNWFSHWDRDTSTALVSLAGWHDVSSISPVAFIAYELVRYGLRVFNPAYDPESLAHEETRGCMFDFCGTKHDIDLKLQTGGLCSPCRNALDDAGIDHERVLRLLDLVRELAVLVRPLVRS